MPATDAAATAMDVHLRALLNPTTPEICCFLYHSRKRTKWADGFRSFQSVRRGCYGEHGLARQLSSFPNTKVASMCCQMLASRFASRSGTVKVKDSFQERVVY
jgi:hypothetical protein